MAKRIAGFLAAGLFLVAVVGTSRADDQKDIQGTWKIEKGVKGGEDMPAEEKDKITLEFKDSKVIVHGGGGDKPAELTLDATAKPKTINITPPNDKKEIHGIYELKGDSLTICFAREGGERPKEFKSEQGTQVMLIVLMREKK